jgi:hypothetical protein
MSDFSKPELRRADDAGEDWRIYRGSSMLRVFAPGDLLRGEKLTAAQVEVGDIIAFDTPGGSVTVHRVIERTARGGLRTMGDNNPRPDPAPVVADAAVLRILEVRRKNGETEPVSRGAAGVKEFRRNRRCRWWEAELPRYAAGVCRRLWPFKRRLGAPVRFGDDEMFYASQPGPLVARRDAEGRVHWFSPWYRVIYRID